MTEEQQATSEDRTGAGEGPAAESEGKASGEESGPKKTIATALGEVSWLLSQSATHRHALFLADLEWLVMPPLTMSQYRMFYSNERPIGAAFWAFVSEEVEQRLAGGGRLGIADWRSGDRVWLVEVVAPFGGQDRMLEDLQKTALADRKFRYMRTLPNGKRETVEVAGDKVV